MVTCTATWASATPVALATNGTVRLARGFASRTVDLVVLDRVLERDQSDHLDAAAIFLVYSPNSASTAALSDWRGSAHAESPECTPASSTCSIMQL